MLNDLRDDVYNHDDNKIEVDPRLRGDDKFFAGMTNPLYRDDKPFIVVALTQFIVVTPAQAGV